MSKKQTRRSISVSGEVYDRLMEYCKASGTTCSGVVEVEVRKFLDMPQRANERTAIVTKPKAVTKQVTEVKVVTPVLEKNGDWDKITGPVERGPVDRVQVIKDAHEFKQAFKKDEPEKKNGANLQDMASKIFTF